MVKDKNQSQIILYQTVDGQIKIQVTMEDETVWLTQQLMAELFQTTKQNISLQEVLIKGICACTDSCHGGHPMSRGYVDGVTHKSNL